jgi:hypothetical protein
LILRDGFRGHTVAVTMDAEEVLRAVGVTTDPVSARAGVITVDGHAGTTWFAVSVTPGNLLAAFEVDTAAHPQVTISLVGEGTVAFEASAISFR